MAKYYVESGSVRLVIQAADARRAALWSVHRVMEQVLPLVDEVPDEADQEPVGGMVLGDAITLNEQGFDRLPDTQYDTLEVVAEWSQLMLALDKIESLARGVC
ncbi:hypothetical protein LOC68_27790 [Blastopirellula sp. JC732]|uniref:Uncharacterized protein n=1 Tax=Blastopirellula sediminis TaxID=2894196 RepID=A0A9X1MRT9_9BACT|nr:hypothetical protein [Blastopirellula sediminis]MCC9604488.1 hypothetical protein [Blastopirellula sediminis]MCC9632213.1 hypothetical protein [Blastopirellula sediminis]